MGEAAILDGTVRESFCEKLEQKHLNKNLSEVKQYALPNIANVLKGIAVVLKGSDFIETVLYCYISVNIQNMYKIS